MLNDSLRCTRAGGRCFALAQVVRVAQDLFWGDEESPEIMFLAHDIAAIAKLGEITPANTVEFTDLVCEALMYRLKSSAGQGKRKEKASTAALAAADLLKFVIDSRFRSESIGLNEIKAAVQSIDPQVRRNINLTRLCSSIYEVNDQAPIAIIPGPPAVGLPGNVPVQPLIDRVLATLGNIHPGCALVRLEDADRELAESIFELSSEKGFPEKQKFIIHNARSSKWSGVELLDRLFQDVDPFVTLSTLLENKFHNVAYKGPGEMVTFFSEKRKCFERLPKATMIRLNQGKELEVAVDENMAVAGVQVPGRKVSRYIGLTQSLVANIMASENSRLQVRQGCQDIMSRGTASASAFDFGLVSQQLIMVDKLDADKEPKSMLKVNNITTKSFKRKNGKGGAKCYNCGEPGHRYWDCSKELKPEFQKKVDAFNTKQKKRKTE